ncbi:hypothetical protein EAE92_10535 [Photorhabdus hainanensis]|nr:hypothetical protein [Photorhabdus hainanensis]
MRLRGLWLKSYDQYVEQALQNEQDAYRRLIHVYTRLAKLTQQAGTIAPYWQQFAKGRIKPTEDQLCAGLLRMMSDQWWYIRLKRIRDIRAEHIAIAVGQVQHVKCVWVIAVPQFFNGCQVESTLNGIFQRNDVTPLTIRAITATITQFIK